MGSQGQQQIHNVLCNFYMLNFAKGL